MFLAWAVSCESYETREDGTTDIYAAGFDTLYVDRLPASLDDLTILVRVLLMEEEEAEIEMHVLGPDTAPIGTLRHQIEPEPGLNFRPGYLVSQTEALRPEGLVAEHPGVYSIEIYTDPQAATRRDKQATLFFSVREDEAA